MSDEEFIRSQNEALRAVWAAWTQGAPLNYAVERVKICLTDMEIWETASSSSSKRSSSGQSSSQPSRSRSEPGCSEILDAAWTGEVIDPSLTRNCDSGRVIPIGEQKPDLPPCMATGTEARVCADIAARQLLGIAKYGTTVENNPLSREEWLQHAYEEALDLAVYLRRAIDES